MDCEGCSRGQFQGIIPSEENREKLKPGQSVIRPRFELGPRVLQLR